MPPQIAGRAGVRAPEWSSATPPETFDGRPLDAVAMRDRCYRAASGIESPHVTAWRIILVAAQQDRRAVRGKRGVLDLECTGREQLRLGADGVEMLPPVPLPREDNGA